MSVAPVAPVSGNPNDYFPLPDSIIMMGHRMGRFSQELFVATPFNSKPIATEVPPRFLWKLAEQDVFLSNRGDSSSEHYEEPTQLCGTRNTTQFSFSQKGTVSPNSTGAAFYFFACSSSVLISLLLCLAENEALLAKNQCLGEEWEGIGGKKGKDVDGRSRCCSSAEGEPDAVCPDSA